MRFATDAERRLADWTRRVNMDNQNVRAIFELAEKYVNPDDRDHQLPAVFQAVPNTSRTTTED